MDRHCGDCKYCGELLKDNLHSCNNDKSIFKACLETATGCEKFEPQESEDKCKNCEYYRNPDYTRCHECEAESENKE